MISTFIQKSAVASVSGGSQTKLSISQSLRFFAYHSFSCLCFQSRNFHSIGSGQIYPKTANIATRIVWIKYINLIYPEVRELLRKFMFHHWPGSTIFLRFVFSLIAGSNRFSWFGYHLTELSLVTSSIGSEDTRILALSSKELELCLFYYVDAYIFLPLFSK